MDTDFHRKRLENLKAVDQVVQCCARKHRIGAYLAGQVTYNMGEYPARFSMAPTEYDEKLLREFADHGVSLIQIHEEWNDSQRCLGATKLTAHDPEGLRRFVDLVHSLGMKIILYASTGFFEATDPDFDPEWAGPHDEHLVELYFDYAHCSPAHPGWRAYLLPKLERIMDEYIVDGLYDDLGRPRLWRHRPWPEGFISPAEETPEHEAALEDLLLLVMDMVHQRGGIFKVHVGEATTVACPSKVYDYLWVGEAVDNLDELRLQTRHFEPYVVPCPDQSRIRLKNEDDLYLHSIPYMQFPLRIDGRPVTGERAMVEGMNYRRGEDCHWSRHMRAIWDYYKAHPEAPPVYGWWDSFPGRAEGRARWLHHLDLYRPMVAPGSVAWIDIKQTTLLDVPTGNDLVASLFVNDRIYLVLANYGSSAVTISSPWSWRNRQTSQILCELHVGPGELLFLQRD